MKFDIQKFINAGKLRGKQFENRMKSLKLEGIQTSCIEKAVNEAIKNLKEHLTRSFVIYGEPQSGKTEMMIALTARLLDEQFEIIVHLLNDNVSLLDQNLRRFKASGLAPAPVNFKEIIDRSVKVDNRPFVIFCKKNQSDLNKLIEKLDGKDRIVVIDDEADFATPNSQINKGKTSKINELIMRLLKNNGIYIGVTATPARLDLNNTFENNHEKWVSFPAHDKYTGQKVFFPFDTSQQYQLTLLPDSAGDDPKHCREALFRFLVNSAYLNIHRDINRSRDNNYTFLIHTSGKKIDHKKDYEEIQKVFTILGDKENGKFKSYLQRIWEIAFERYSEEADIITSFIAENILRYEIKVLNSDADVMSKGTSPSCPFTVIIGGNIISRGVTFDNLLSMFFTRDVKHKLQQDTYIQRARMFGSRGEYLNFFELTIPDQLYADWNKCFVFHSLALSSIEKGDGAPVWLSDRRVSAVATNSIDRANVSLDSGEMSYGLFNYNDKKEQITAIMGAADKPSEKVMKLQALLGSTAFPDYVLDFVNSNIAATGSQVMVHDPVSIAGMHDANQETIARTKGFMGGANFTKNAHISHHFRIHHNDKGSARVFYKYVSGVTFIKNIKREMRNGKRA